MFFKLPAGTHFVDHETDLVSHNHYVYKMKKKTLESIYYSALHFIRVGMVLWKSCVHVYTSS